MTAGPIWERQPGETEAAYAAFVAYRDLPTGQRSLDQARQRTGKAPSTVRNYAKWSSAHRWVERSAAYDAWADTIRRDERERGYREEERLRFQRRRELLETEMDIASKAMERVKQGLSGPMFRQTIKDTDTGQVTIIEPTKWTFRDLAAVFVLADRRARLALDMFGDAARAPTPEPEGAGTSDVERYIEGLLQEALEEATPSGD